MNETDGMGQGGIGEWAEALGKLPHGNGFRFLDRLVALDPGISGRGEWLVRGDEDFLRGHFPGNPLVPGVIMIEALAQLAGVVFCSDLGNGDGGRLLLTAVRSVKITGTAGPGEILEIEVEITGKLGPLVQAAGAVSAEGRELMRGEVVLSGG